MDSMTYYGQDLTPASDTRAADRAAVRTAILVTVVSIVLTVGAVLALSAAGLPLPVATEFSMMPLQE